jgi:hypothetical protein
VRQPAGFIKAVSDRIGLFDNKDNAMLAHDRASGVKKLVTINGIKHYVIYNEACDQAQKETNSWFADSLCIRQLSSDGIFRSQTGPTGLIVRAHPGDGREPSVGSIESDKENLRRRRRL